MSTLLINKLDNRLRLIADFVRYGSKVADIGCDHAYVISALMEAKICSYAIGVENKIGPLNNAKKQPMIDCRLGDGLSVILEDEVDDIIIAGMGSEMIIKILTECIWSKNKDKHYILEPMTKPELLRRWLYDNGFEIEREKACIVGGKPYSVMSVYFTDSKADIDVYLGKLEKSKEADEYVAKVIKQLKKKPDTKQELLWHLMEF